MNIYLLGNGFDIYHSFPTRYIDFLQIVDFMCKHYNDSMTTIGSLLSSFEQQSINPFVNQCYHTHKSHYDNACLKSDVATEIVQQAKENMWFNYFLKSYNKDLGWIDFEREIASVIDIFRNVLTSCKKQFNISKKTPKEKYVLRHFQFFFQLISSTGFGTWGDIKQQYLIEEPVGTNEYTANTIQIIAELHNSLRELCNILKRYLECFVDNILATVAKDSFVSPSIQQEKPDYTITFNYTNTLEKLYGIWKNTMHLHGNINKEIVLGINPDQYDDGATTDISFVQFKKYFQRMVYRTDQEYLDNILLLKQTKARHDYTLHVIGHSLDISDEDIIREVFGFAAHIVIHYHNEEYIKKLIVLFGKDGLMWLRQEKGLQFLLLPKIKWNAVVAR